ncbi:UvrD-helicase domain-containing protein [Williamsia sp. CHRR-6]|uniref:UvrD-helicase domain-containing protein n=1 Tax=Williamsia sp. CHRR-6 TaxID=2835871 RepID=UPI001BD9BB9D|nr:UvrD-helicase domain-containing protein [Williamsia sp. CHRR-6]MBT0568188.1 UvrD-helicase domain-containing protein [Williamsia sp. CHRR-6]
MTGPISDTFSLTAQLPSGTTVVEASAGTGKTFAIVGLAARHIAEGLPIDQLLLVTFSRVATAELRERLRDRLAGLVGVGDKAMGGQTRSDTDELARSLASGDAATVALRRDRIRRALSDFDSATVCTTHTFCSRMLDGLGVAGERERGLTLVEEVDDLVDDVAGDVYLKWYSGSQRPPFPFRHASPIARAAVRQPHAIVAPTDAAAGSEPAERVRFVAAVRREVLRRKRMSRIRDYDELQSMLAAVIADPVHGEAACRRIRARYSVVLVDEFQDTDPMQWDILRRCFHGHTTLILVGDPKQSIYKFRGAEVLSYLDAAGAADSRQALGVNWRSDSGLVAALHHLYGGAQLGHRQITVGRVHAAQQDPRIPALTPLRVRYLRRAGHGPLSDSGFPAVAALREAVAADVADDIARLLHDPPEHTDGAAVRPVRPSDVAVLVRTRSTIDLVQSALAARGIASVVGAGNSVFATDSARDWFHLLRAVEQPTRSDRLALVAVGPLIGRTPAELDADTDEVLAQTADLVIELAEILVRAGFAAMYETLCARTDLQARILSTRDGERTMTDIAHLAGLCNRHAVDASAGITLLLRWFLDRLADPRVGDQSEQSRRLDRDAQAVTIMTVHGSKGLEFPIVYVPFGWDAARNPYPATLDLHDGQGRRVIDVGGSEHPDFRRNQNTADAEDAGEELRLFYVAVTRARSHVVAWWAPGHSTAAGPLTRLMFGRAAGGHGLDDPARRGRVPADTELDAAMHDWARSAGGLISVEPAGVIPPIDVDLTTPSQGRRDLQAARWDGTVDHSWRRTSYSAIVGDHHIPAAAVVAEPERFTVDEPDDPDDTGLITSTSQPAPAAAESLMNGLPGGAAFGTVVHEALERIDPAAADLDAEVLTACTHAVTASGLTLDLAQLATAISAVVHTPLSGPDDPDDLELVDLAAITRRDRLAEMEFEFPLAPRAQASALSGIAAVLTEHLPADDLLAGYPDDLRSLPPTDLAGFLTGSIDAVLRVGQRHLVIDYKTNRLGAGDLTVEHYTPAAMAAEMRRSHYPLQALLYSVAVHRFLRWRLAGYRPDTHLGPIKYLFVRAMIGPETPSGRGVFSWSLPPAAVVAVSDLLGGM